MNFSRARVEPEDLKNVSCVEHRVFIDPRLSTAFCSIHEITHHHHGNVLLEAAQRSDID